MSLKKKSALELSIIAQNLGICWGISETKKELIAMIRRARQITPPDQLGHAAGSTNWGTHGKF